MNVPINPHAPVKAFGQLQIEAPVDTVWEVLTHIANWKTWQKAVTETIVFGIVMEGTTFHWKADGISFTSTIHTCVHNAQFGWTGKTMGASAIHNWIFEEQGNTTLVKVEESLQGVLPFLFRRFFQKNLDKGVATSLTELKAASEKMAVTRW